MKKTNNFVVTYEDSFYPSYFRTKDEAIHYAKEKATDVKKDMNIFSLVAEVKIPKFTAEVTEL